MEYELFDGKDSSISFKLGSFKDPGEAILKINEMFKKNCFRLWPEKSATLKEKDGKKEKNSFSITIEGEGINRIATIAGS